MRYTFLFLILCQIIAGTATSTEDFRLNFNNAPLWNTPAPSLEKAKTTIKVGLLIPLSGENKNIGQSILNASLLGLYKFPDTNITLIPLDSGTTEEQASVAATQAINKECDLILGPVFSKQVAAVKRKIPKTINIISFSNDLTKAGGNTFIAGYSPHEQTKFIIQFLINKDISHIVGLLPDNAYGKEVARIFGRTIQSQVGQKTQVYFYDSEGASDEFLDKLSVVLQEDKPEAIYIPDADRKTLTLVSKLKFKGLSLQETLVLGSSDWNKPLFTNDHGLKGALFPQIKMGTNDAFTKSYQDAFSTPPNLFAELSYDLIMMINTLYQKGAAVCLDAKEITTESGFQGTRGRFYFDTDGSVHREYALMEITGNKPKKVQEQDSVENLIVEKYRHLFDVDYSGNNNESDFQDVD